MRKNWINFKLPPHPKNIFLIGKTINLLPLNSDKKYIDLYSSQFIDKHGINWEYLPYVPLKSKITYLESLKKIENKNDPVFIFIIRKSDNKAVGLTSFMWINIKYVVIEVGNIKFSPLYQKT